MHNELLEEALRTVADEVDDERDLLHMLRGLVSDAIEGSESDAGEVLAQELRRLKHDLALHSRFGDENATSPGSLWRKKWARVMADWLE